jgi:hypothetical protein
MIKYAPSMETPSLLSRSIAQRIFEEYKKDLSRNGQIIPALHVFRDIDGTGMPVASVVEVELPNEPQKKQIYFSRVKEQLQKKGTILEALYINERQGLLAMMGRNKDKSRVTMVEQQFSRKSDGTIIWEEVEKAEYNVPSTKNGQFREVGIIDYIFPPLN